MSALLVGYARCFTDAQDLTAQRDALATLSWSRSSTASPALCPTPARSRTSSLTARFASSASRPSMRFVAVPAQLAVGLCFSARDGGTPSSPGSASIWMPRKGSLFGRP